MIGGHPVMMARPPVVESRLVQPPTIDDVARVADVSVTTVWRVLKGNARVRPAAQEAVIRAIALLRFTPASPLLHGAPPPMRIGLIRTTESAGYLNAFMVGSLDRVAASTMQLVIEQCDMAERPAAAARRLAQRGIDGVVLPPALCDAGELLDMLEQQRMPTVLMAGQPTGSASTLDIDDFQAAHDMTTHLVRLGHGRIGFIMGCPTRPASRRRYDGYRGALADHGVAVEDDLIAAGSSTYRSGLDAAEVLLDAEAPPTAIFASDDDTAAATISVAHRRGLNVPSDLTVCGFGDSPVATTIWPNITTVRLPTAQMGTIAADLIAAAIAARREGHAPPAERITLPHQLVRRQSDAAPRRRPRAAIQV